MIISFLIAAFTASSDCPLEIPSISAVQTDESHQDLVEAYHEDLVERLRHLESPTEEPTNAWEYFLSADQTTADERASCLLNLVSHDMYIRLELGRLGQEAAPEDERRQYMISASRTMAAIDQRNREWLRGQVENHGWFSISGFGEDADQAAFLIVQHADGDIAFQQEMLDLLLPLAASGETSVIGFSYLMDRVAVNTGERQLYGTQGWCTGPNSWEPREYEGSRQDVDGRRQAIGLQPLENYISHIAQNCTTDQRY
ncbi:DUF6624 domain-containing protein [Hyphobacterium sp.]|uniref:DUF6624 domain-containing protein n=1 Tax=Hyphobacterium sp. TaxID=2004662 RepID=UPI0037495FCB